RHCVKLTRAMAASQPGLTVTARFSPALVIAKISRHTGAPPLRTTAHSPATCSAGFAGAAAAAALWRKRTPTPGLGASKIPSSTSLTATSDPPRAYTKYSRFFSGKHQPAIVFTIVKRLAHVAL